MAPQSVSFMHFARQFKWYHWVGSLGTAAAMNVGCMVGFFRTYQWVYADYEEETKRFKEKYGLPTEKQRMEIFDWIAPKYDETIGEYEKRGADGHRWAHLDQVRGDVLEVAVGSGRCFEAMEQSEEIKSYVGLDCSEAMLEAVRPKLPKLPYPAKVVNGNAEQLPFPDDSFDTVVGSLCICSVERPATALDEMGRVCRPGGQVLLVEPGLAKSAVTRWAQRQMGLVPDPKHAWECGWFDNREPVALVQASERLTLEDWKTRAMGNWYLIKAVPK